MSSYKPMGIRQALSLTFVQTTAAFACNIATIVVVSRLLTPDEIGVFAVATALIALAQMLRSFGVGDFVIQEEKLTDALIRSAFTLNLFISWFLAAFIYVLSYWIGKLYGEPGVTRVIRVLSLVFVLMPFGAITMSRIKREMNFSLIVHIQIAEVMVRSISTIALAYFGFSYMSMAWGSVAAMSVVVIGSLIFGAKYRVNGISFHEWRRVLKFGLNRTVVDIVRKLGMESANIVIGVVLGMGAAGFYSRGYGIVRIFGARVVGAVASVAFPAFAREHREKNSAPLLFRKSLVYLTGISWPFFLFCTLMALPLIRITFGDQWDPAVPLMRWLCIAGMISTLMGQCNHMLTAVGRYREVTAVEAQYQLLRIVLVVVAAFYSLEAVAASQVLVYLTAAVLYCRKLAQYKVLKFRPLLRALAPSAMLSIVTNSVPAAVLLFWPVSMSQNYILELLFSSVGSAFAWLFGLFLLRHPLWLEVVFVISISHRRVLSVIRDK